MKTFFLIPIAAAFILTSCKNDIKEEKTAPTEIETTKEKFTTSGVKEGKVISFLLDSKSESTAKGKVVFSQKGKMVQFEAFLEGLTPGTHAIHIHEKADCSSTDGKSSGGHWNPTFKDHGKWGSSKGYHKGDIGNFKVDEDGIGSVSMQTDEWCIGCDDDTKNILGKAIIVHQGTDDFTSQPSGAAGARVSCGGIIE